MICPICGTKNKEDAVRCSKCNLILVPNKVREKMEAAARTENIKKASSYAVPHSLSDGRYLIVKKLGAGGMSRVLLARDKKMDCYVVIKELLPFFEFDDIDEADYLENRFMSEAKLLYRLDNKGLPKVMDYFGEQERLYFVMQFIDGDTLADIAQQREENQITLEEGFKWMKDIIDVLIYLHNQNPPILHRDIKPHNIMLDKTGKIFLVDFGIAREVKGQVQTGTSVGTYGYASPEHFTGKYEISSDLYCLGATFHMLLSGEDPRERPPFKFYPLSNYRDDIPERLDEIFERMVEMDSKKRYQTAKALKVDLVSFITEYYGKDITGSSELELAEIQAATAARKASKARGDDVDNPTDVIKGEEDESTKRVSSGFLRGKKARSKTKEKAQAGVGANSRAGLFKSRKSKKKKKTTKIADDNEIVVGARGSGDGSPGTSTGKTTNMMDRKPVSSIKKKSTPLPMIILYSVLAIVFILGISYFLFVHVLKMKNPITALVKRRYAISVISKSNTVIYQMKKIIGDKYEYKTSVEQKSLKKKHGFRVVQKFSSKRAADQYKIYLRKKNQPAKVVEGDSPDEFYVQIGNIYSNSNDAAKKVKLISKIMPTKFVVQDNYRKIPYSTYRLYITGIEKKTDAEELKAKLEELKPDKIDMLEYESDEKK